MTIKELKEILANCNDDAAVCVPYYDYYNEVAWYALADIYKINDKGGLILEHHDEDA